MEAREGKLLENGALLSGVFLDPRYQILLTDHEKVIAKQHLKDLHRRLNNRGGIPETRSDSRPSASADPMHEEEEEDELERLLRQTERIKAASGNGKGGDSSSVDLSLLLDSFDGVPRIPYEEDVFHFWRSYPSKELRMLAEVACSVPVTQVSLERLFSALRYILSDVRNRLREDIIDAILFLRLNGVDLETSG